METPTNYKMQAATEALKHIKGKVIGLGAGTSMVEHSLFYGLATKAIIAGKEGIRIIEL